MSEEETFEPTSLDAILGDDDPPETKIEEPEKVEETAEKEEAEAEPEKKEESEEPKDEEQKTEQADNFAALRKVVAEQKQKITELEKKEPEPAPDVLEDPEGFKKHMERSFDVKFATMSEAMAKAQFADYDEVAARFYKEAETNPSIIGTVTAAPLPALELYSQGKRLLSLDDIGDPSKYRDRIEAELRVKIETEMKVASDKSAEDKAKLINSLPDDLTLETNVGERKGPAFAPTPLEKLFPD